jgi:hypothetical protein
MRALQFVFAGCFAVSAASCIYLAAALVATADFAFPGSPVPGGAPKILASGLALALAALFSIAVWAIIKAWPSARYWDAGASLVLLVGGLVSLLHRPFHLMTAAWIPLAAGTAGLIVFAPRHKARAQASNQRAKGPLPGDGTSRMGNQLVLVAGAVGSIGGVRLLSLWARAHGFPRGFPSFFAFQVLLAILVVLAIHEAGHAVAGFAVRMKLIGFVVGPFNWSRAYGKARLIFSGAGLIRFGGQTMVAPATMESFRIRKAIQVAGGPAASLLAGALGVWAVFAARGRPWQHDWAIVAIFADISTLVGLLNLAPFGNKSMYSDGAKLYQILAGGLWSDYHRLLGAVASTAVTPLRPRDYDLATIHRAIGVIAQGRDEIFLRVCAYNCCLDRRNLQDAAAEIGRAEAITVELGIEPAIERCATFVFADALLRRDAAAACRWWQRIESKPAYRFTENLWPARSALLLSEGKIDEAADACKKAADWARQLPATGAGEAERNNVELLQEALRQVRPNSAIHDAPVVTE